MKNIAYSYETKFVDYIPEKLEPGVLYISIAYNTAVHLCACGCGTEIVTPLDRNIGWVLTYDGDNASLFPSIGNGNYECHSHYYLKDGTVKWLPNFDERHVEKTKLKPSWLLKVFSHMKGKK